MAKKFVSYYPSVIFETIDPPPNLGDFLTLEEPPFEYVVRRVTPTTVTDDLPPFAGRPGWEVELEQIYGKVEAGPGSKAAAMLRRLIES